MSKTDWLSKAEHWLKSDSGDYDRVATAQTEMSRTQSLYSIACVLLHNALRERERQAKEDNPPKWFVLDNDQDGNAYYREIHTGEIVDAGKKPVADAPVFDCKTAWLAAFNAYTVSVGGSAESGQAGIDALAMYCHKHGIPHK